MDILVAHRFRPRALVMAALMGALVLLVTVALVAAFTAGSDLLRVASTYGLPFRWA